MACCSKFDIWPDLDADQRSVTNLQWQSIAASADVPLVATTSTGSQPLSGPIYTSADSGKTWMSNAISVQNWVGTASSADGTQLLALVPQSSRIAASTNSGASWTFSIAPAQLAVLLHLRRC